VKKIPFEELEKLSYIPGGKEIMVNFLQIQSEEAKEELNMATEPEYNMSEQDIIKLLTEGSLDAFLDCLDFAPVGVIDLVKKLAISLPLNDIQKRRALKEKTGFDVSKTLEHIEEAYEEDGQKATTEAPKRRVKATTTETSGRRASLPEYKVVDTTSAED
jgi:hypothetical protein